MSYNPFLPKWFPVSVHFRVRYPNDDNDDADSDDDVEDVDNDENYDDYDAESIGMMMIKWFSVSLFPSTLASDINSISNAYL